jgi:transcriptional regulator with PAS, ATPase and Fis domain
MEGFVRNHPIKTMHVDVTRGDFFGEYVWASSWEAQAHLQMFGLSGEPACWIMNGYADGYCTAITGLPIHWREVECVAMGHSRCRVIGRPVSEWSAAELADGPVAAVVSTVDLQRSSQDKQSFEGFVGVSGRFSSVVNLIRRVAPTDTTVLFKGESGVGKECFARALHAISKRSRGPMIAINCAAIPGDLVEAELFGVEKGAFTGADHARPGRFERADGGTLFLDEIACLSPAAQGKLLRAIQEREIERVGGTETRKVNVRIVAAANLDLRAETEAGRFRQDLFYRLNVFPVEIPPLRERREDIPLLVSHFLRIVTLRLEKTIKGLTPQAYAMVLDYDWPGNVRELENMIERAVILAEDDGVIDIPHLFSGGEKFSEASFGLGPKGNLVSFGTKSISTAPDLKEDLLDQLLDLEPSLDEIESSLLKRAMARSGGNVSATARLLKMRRGQVEYRMKKRSDGE